MRIRHLVVTTLAVTAGALAVAAPAQAKGALSATITGPGLSSPVRLVPDNSHAILFIALGSGTKVDQLAFGGAVPTSTPPTKQLGPAYQLTFDYGCLFPRDDNKCQPAELRVVAYPLADGGPMVSVPPGQRRPYENIAVPAGWLRGDAGLARTMVQAGVPLRTPSPTPKATGAAVAATQPAATTGDSGGTPRRPVVVTIGLGALVLAVLAAWRLRRGRPTLVDQGG